MKISLYVLRTFEARYLQIDCGVRYPEDSYLNGVEDVDGNMPFLDSNGRWKLFINIDTGLISNWPKEPTTAKIHYKVCDDGTYTLLDIHEDQIISLDGYVPSMLAPNGNGFGDYIKMNINEHGEIENWKPDLDYFKSDND